MAIQLKDKIAIVTGGASGVGEAVAHKLAGLGARVLIVGLPGDPVPEVVETIQKSGGWAQGYIGDVAVETQAEECVQEALDIQGRLDILVNLAGMNLEPVETEHMRVRDFDRMIFANIRSVFLMTKLALPHLRESRGCIVSAGSELGSIGINSVYGATKSWVHSFMKGIAVEAAADGVRANTVCTGPVDPAWTHGLIEVDPEVEKNLIRATPMGRKARPEEIASVFAFLASDEASFVTGALYSADGGMALGTSVLRKDQARSRQIADAFP